MEYEERELWQHAEILYDWDDPGPPCIKETQTRTRFNVYDSPPPPSPLFSLRVFSCRGSFLAVVLRFPHMVREGASQN